MFFTFRSKRFQRGWNRMQNDVTHHLDLWVLFHTRMHRIADYYHYKIIYFKVELVRSRI